jgi:UDP-2-acetamido-3-amino-2,3-dideoxy-glucuronate N-acetyltransferase
VTSPAVLIELPEFADERGSLVVAERLKQLPFSVERIFFVSGVPRGDKRGIHAHRKCHQVLICLAGSVKALVDDGRESEVVVLDRSNLALHMPPLTWGTQFDYSADAVLLVLTSHGYDVGDYIDDYEEFFQLATGAR